LSGVFISYQRGDEALARRITLALRALGVDVWWDQDMLSVDWQTELERRGNDLAAVAVVWSPSAAVSDSVRDEARLGLKSKKLVNLLSGLAEPPYPFDRVNGIPLDDWEGVVPSGNWRRFVASLDDKLAAHGSIAGGALKARLAAQEDEFRKREREITAAAAAVATAGRTLSREHAALAGLREKLGEAEAQIDGLRKIKASPAVLATARSEHEAASAQLCTAEADVARAGAGVEEADCKLDTTKRALTQWIAEQGGAGSEGVATLAARDVPVVEVRPAPAEPPPVAPVKEKAARASGAKSNVGVILLALIAIVSIVAVIATWKKVPVAESNAEAAVGAAADGSLANAAARLDDGADVPEIRRMPVLLDEMQTRTWGINGSCTAVVKFERGLNGVTVTTRVPGIADETSLDRIVADGFYVFKTDAAQYRPSPGAVSRVEELTVTPLDKSQPYKLSPCLNVKF
jgi:TIR domain